MERDDFPIRALLGGGHSQPGLKRQVYSILVLHGSQDAAVRAVQILPILLFAVLTDFIMKTMGKTFKFLNHQIPQLFFV